ncbi:MAG: glycosyltransferase [Bacteroidales bacterium]
MDSTGKQLPFVLVCPLNWGLGHATRCVPVIRAFSRAGAQVGVAGDGPALAFLKASFPKGVSFYRLPGKTITYSRNRGGCSMVLKLLWQFPGLLYSVFAEHRRLRALIRETGAGIVVSDNRYGLYSTMAIAIFMGHQLFLRAPKGLGWMEGLINEVNHRYINRFHYCWVPDFPGPENLSGELSHSSGEKPEGAAADAPSAPARFLAVKKGPPEYTRFVGTLSRFSGMNPERLENPLPAGFPVSFYLVLLSGPEPQRGLLERELDSQFSKAGHAVVFVRGVVMGGSSDSARESTKPKAIWFDHLPDPPLAWLIRNSRLVVCRSGYSTIMDLSVFGKRALLVPTPGQTEQEYLGRLMEERGWVACTPQDTLCLEWQLDAAGAMKGIPRLEDKGSLLAEAVEEILHPGGAPGNTP